MTLEEYQREYERLLRWREVWCRFSSKMERGRLEVRQEAIERKARIANQNIGRLVNQFDREQRAPYEYSILGSLGNGAYRQDILDRFYTNGRTNGETVCGAIQALERQGFIERRSGPCSVHKGPLYVLKSQPATIEASVGR